jgi:hypothetical protein
MIEKYTCQSSITALFPSGTPLVVYSMMFGLVLWLADIVTDVQLIYALYWDEPLFFTSSLIIYVLPGVIHGVADIVQGGNLVIAVITCCSLRVPYEVVMSVRMDSRSTPLRLALVGEAILESFPSGLLQMYIGLYAVHFPTERIVSIVMSVVTLAYVSTFDADSSDRTMDERMAALLYRRGLDRD